MEKTKKVLAVLLSSLLIMSVLAACGGSTSSSSSAAAAPASSTSMAASTAASTAGGGGKAVDSLKGWKMAMVVDAPIQDGNWNSACYAAMQAVAEKYGIETKYSENVAQSDFAQTFREYCNMGFQIIFSPGSQYADAAAEVAGEFPDCYFMLLNSDKFGDNYIGMAPNLVQQGYMAGALAAVQTRTGKVGFVGGKDLPTTHAKRDNYKKAIALLRPDVEVFDAIVGSFTDTAKGKEVVTTMVNDHDVDVMYGDAGSIDAGVREFLKDQTDRWQIGQPGNITDLMPEVIVGCVVTDNQVLLELAMEEIMAGTFGGKVLEGTLENGVLSVGTFGQGISKEDQDLYLQIIETIKDGTFETAYADGLPK